MKQRISTMEVLDAKHYVVVDTRSFNKVYCCFDIEEARTYVSSLDNPVHYVINSFINDNFIGTVN